METPVDEAELLALLSQFCDGTLDARATLRLNEMLRESADARQIYTDYLHQHAVLETTLDALPLSIADIIDQASESGPPQGPFRLPYATIILSIAAVIIAVLLVTRGDPIKAPPKSSSSKAPLSVYDVFEATFSEITLEKGQDIKLDQMIAVEEGALGLECANGVAIILEANTQFKLESGTRGVLMVGRISVRVPPSVSEFTIQTPHGEVVVRRTAFHCGCGDRSLGSAERDLRRQEF